MTSARRRQRHDVPRGERLAHVANETRRHSDDTMQRQSGVCDDARAGGRRRRSGNKSSPARSPLCVHATSFATRRHPTHMHLARFDSFHAKNATAEAAAARNDANASAVDATKCVECDEARHGDGARVGATGPEDRDSSR